MDNIVKGKAAITVEGKIWLNIGGETFLGKGKIELLENIKKFGTLYQAAEAMKISYRQAYTHVKKINNLTEKPLIVLRHGGKGGGGSSEITEAGEKAIVTFKQFQIDLAKFLEEKTNMLDF